MALNPSGMSNGSLRWRFLSRLPVVVPWIVTLAPAAAVVVAGYQLATGRAGLFELAVLGVMYVLTFLGVTVGFHRLFSHHSFTALAVTRGLLAILGSMALQGPVIWWVAVHRQHHKSTDQRDDPHTPYANADDTGLASLRGLWHAHVGWLFDTHATRSEGLLQVFRTYTPDLLKDEVVLSVHLRYWECVALGLALPAAAGALWYGSAEGALQGLVWGGLVRIFFVSHAFWIVNSVGHTWGRRPFRARGRAANLGWLGVPTLGEAWHNNHHAFPRSARIGLAWWQVDIGYLFIRALEALGLVAKVRVPSQDERARKSSAL